MKCLAAYNISISNTKATVSYGGQFLNYHRVWPCFAVRVAWPVVRRGLTVLYGPPQPLLELWTGSNMPVRRPKVLIILKLVTRLSDLCRFINPISVIHNARSEITRSWSINMATPTRCFIIIARPCLTICDPRVLVLLLRLHGIGWQDKQWTIIGKGYGRKCILINL